MERNYSHTDNKIERYYSALSPATREAARGCCEIPEVRYALTMFSGASKVAPFVRYNFASFYYSGSVDELAAELQLKPHQRCERMDFHSGDDGFITEPKTSGRSGRIERAAVSGFDQFQRTRGGTGCRNSPATVGLLTMAEYEPKEVDISFSLLLELMDALKRYGSNVVVIAAGRRTFFSRVFRMRPKNTSVLWMRTSR